MKGQKQLQLCMGRSSCRCEGAGALAVPWDLLLGCLKHSLLPSLCVDIDSSLLARASTPTSFPLAIFPPILNTPRFLQSWEQLQAPPAILYRL